MPQVLYNYSFDKSPLTIVDFKMHQIQIHPTLVNVKHDRLIAIRGVNDLFTNLILHNVAKIMTKASPKQR